MVTEATTSSNVRQVLGNSPNAVTFPSLPNIPRGLHNERATCYAMSCMQSLFHLPPFREIVKNITPGVGGRTVDIFRVLFDEMMDANDDRLINPVQLRDLCLKWGLHLDTH